MMDALFSFLQSPTAVAVSAGLLVTLPVGLVVTLILVCLLRLLSPRRAGWRYSLCLGGLLLIVSSALLMSAWLVEFPEGPRLLHGQILAETHTKPAADLPIGMPVEPGRPVRESGVRPAAELGESPSPEMYTFSLLAWFLWFSPWMTGAWLCGALFFTSRFLIGLLADHRLVQAAHPLEDPEFLQQIHVLAERVCLTHLPRVVCSNLVSSPAVHGWWRSTLLLPVSFATRFPPDQIEVILLHELAHLRRHDYLVNLIQMLIDALLFFNPMVWWLNRQIRLEREACCDLVASQDCSATALAHALSDLAGALKPSPMAAAQRLGGFPRGSLLNRIQRLLRPETRPKLHLSLYQCASFLGSWGVGLLFLFFVSRQAALLAQPFWTPATYEAITAQHEKQQRFGKGGQGVQPARIHVVDPEGRTYVVVFRKNAPRGVKALSARILSGNSGTDGFHLAMKRRVVLMPLADAADLPAHFLTNRSHFPQHDLLWLSVPGFALADIALSDAEHGGRTLTIPLKRADPLGFQLTDVAGKPLAGSPVTVEVWLSPVIESRKNLVAARDRRASFIRGGLYQANDKGWVTLNKEVCEDDRGKYRFFISAPGYEPRVLQGDALDGVTLALKRLRKFDVVLRDADGQVIQDGWVRPRTVRIGEQNERDIWLEPAVGMGKTDASGRGQVWFPADAREIVIEAGVGHPLQVGYPFDSVPDHRLAVAVVSPDHQGPVTLTLKKYGADIVIEKGDADLSDFSSYKLGMVQAFWSQEVASETRSLGTWSRISLTEEADRFHGRVESGLPGILLRLRHPLGEQMVEPDEDGVYRLHLSAQAEAEAKLSVPLREVTLLLEVAEGAAPPEGTLSVSWSVPNNSEALAWNHHKTQGFWPRNQVPLSRFYNGLPKFRSSASLQVAVRDGRAVFHAPSGVKVRTHERGLIGYRTEGSGLGRFQVPEGTGPVTLTFTAKRRGVVALNTPLPVWIKEELSLSSGKLFAEARFVHRDEQGFKWVEEDFTMRSGRTLKIPIGADSVSVHKGALQLSAHVPLDKEMQLFVQLNGVLLLSEPFRATVSRPTPVVRFDWARAWAQTEIETTYQGEALSFWPNGHIEGWPANTFTFGSENLGTQRLTYPKGWESHIRIGAAGHGWTLSHRLLSRTTQNRDNRHWLFYGKQVPLEPDLPRQNMELDLWPLPREGDIAAIVWRDVEKRMWQMVLSQRYEDEEVLLTPLYLSVFMIEEDGIPGRVDRSVPFRLLLKKSDHIIKGLTESQPLPRRFVTPKDRQAFNAGERVDVTLVTLHLDQAEELVPNMLWRFDEEPLRLGRDRLNGAMVALDPGKHRLVPKAPIPDTGFQFSNTFWDRN
ncbi:M56 family metallopeptidase [Acanthopleuribacter pedis]|uniref:M56 family metallopeptidase n=1 Tax=Acanthopleuribacter pedis TaxID=442870 RepID=A0A8J7QLE0_9BACT|nr:M56 family metallopeptidase [Acanthopleuribacter pedis]MBO1320408.1 M56 family metallopeptidase [Acanthopleuribacter pedis]